MSSSISCSRLVLFGNRAAVCWQRSSLSTFARHQGGPPLSTLATTKSLHSTTNHPKSLQSPLAKFGNLSSVRSFSTKDDVPAAATVVPPPAGTFDTSTLLDAFRDPLTRTERNENEVGRSWHARELRRKSFEDLHKLWFVLYKERNMLLTEAHLARRNQMEWVQPTRLRKVRKSMGAIKQVLGERKRAKIAAFREKQQQQQQLAVENDDEMMIEDGEDVEYDEEEGNKQKP